jgi:uncharacterized protein YbaR (Trm112 family)
VIEMVVVFGWGGETKDLGEVAPAICPRCRNTVFLHHIRTDKRVSLYFIPLVPYGTDEYLACPICRNGLQVRKEQRAAIEGMRNETRQFRRGVIPEDAYRARAERFWRQLGAGPSGGQVVQPAASIPAPAVPLAEPRPAAVPPATPAAAQAGKAPDVGDQLRRLAELHADGILDDAEFAAAKRRILGI